MAGLYSNRFRIELNDMARLVFIDERAPAAEGLPMASATAAEIVLTIDNAKALVEALDAALKRHRR